MSSYSQFNSSPTNPLASEYVTTSQVYTARATGWVNFVAVGGGGGAKGFWGSFRWGIVYGEQLYNNGAGCAGAAGGLAIKSVYVTAGTSYTITIGAGGTGMTHYSGFNTNGRAGSGSVTSVIGPGISLVVTGGQGGGSSGSITLNAVGGSIANPTNATYDYYAAGGNATGSATDAFGGSSVGIFGNGKSGVTGGYGAGTGGSGSTNSNTPSNGYPNEIGRNYTRQLAGGIATTSNFCETSSITAANSGVLSNCGGGGKPEILSQGGVNVAATGGRGAVFAGGGIGAAYNQNYNGGEDQNGQQLSSTGTGAAGGYGGGGAAGYAYKWWGTYQEPWADPGILAYGIGGAGGQGLVIVEYL